MGDDMNSRGTVQEEVCKAGGGKNESQPEF